MFIQLDCGCIGLAIEDNDGALNYYAIIDCAERWDGIDLHKSNDDLKYKRFRQLKDEELYPIIQLFQQAITESRSYQKMRSALNLPNQIGGNSRHAIVQNLNSTFVKYRTMKTTDTIDKPDRFPMDFRLESEKQKETDYINRHSNKRKE
jgi:hypothetical protein